MSSHRDIPPPPPPTLSPAARFAVVAYTSGLGTGFAPVASGTFGTLPGVVLFLALAPWNTWGAPLALYLAATAALFAAGVPTSTLAERLHGRTDSGRVVIDEVVGFLVTMLLVPFHVAWIAAGFVAFRAFDVLKPWPGDRLQRLPGGWGIMADDVVAGVYACATLHVALAVVRYLGWPAFAVV